MRPTHAPLPYPHRPPAVKHGYPGIAVLSRLARTFDRARAGSSLLQAAVVSALVVGADQFVQSWTNGSLLSDWVVLWGLAFASMALLAAPTRRAAARLRAALKTRHKQRMQAAQDEQYWEAALDDPRIMAEIRRAMGANGAGPRRTYMDLLLYFPHP